MPRREVQVALLLVLLVGWAVWWQLRPAPETTRTVEGGPVLAIGDALDPAIVLQDLEGTPTRLADGWGERATVLYAWSTTCGCVPTLHEGLSDLEARFGEAQGVAWIAIDGEPKDRAEAIRARQTEVGSRYRVLLDPTHRLCQVLGFDRAAVIAVLDGDGYLRWWGNPTDRLYEPTRHDLAEALPALLAGEPVPASQREPTYGCAFSGALEDCP